MIHDLATVWPKMDQDHLRDGNGSLWAFLSPYPQYIFNNAVVLQKKKKNRLGTVGSFRKKGRQKTGPVGRVDMGLAFLTAVQECSWILLVNLGVYHAFPRHKAQTGGSDGRGVSVAPSFSRLLCFFSGAVVRPTPRPPAPAPRHMSD